MYTKPVGTIVQKHNMTHQSYANDTQGYHVIETPASWPDVSTRTENCVSEISLWMNSNSLKLNQDKFEYILFHPKHRKPHPGDFSLTLSGITYLPAGKVKNLGVVQDSCLTMEQQISSITRSCYHQIRTISRIRSYINKDTCKMLVSALVTSRLDYANTLLYGIPHFLSSRLQRLQNCAAPLVTLTPRRAHITPVLKELHWLPADYRPRYKVLLLTYKVLHGQAPSYLSDMLTVYQPTRTLRSSNRSLLEVPRARTSYGKRTFRYASAVPWNDLPQHVKTASSVTSFKKLLKTHLFKLAYSL